VISFNTAGKDEKVIYQGLTYPDGIAVDKAAGFIYVSIMGSAGRANNGSIIRMGLDGKGMTTLVAPGKTHTPKQLTLVEHDGQKKLYWGDREGMKVMRCNINGGDLEVVVDTAKLACPSRGAATPACRYVVGVAVDSEKKMVYWTQKGSASAGDGSIHRAPLTMKAGEAADRRTDIVTLLSGLPEPIDLQWVSSTGTLYWTDRAEGADGEQSGVSRILIPSGASIDQNQIKATQTLLFGGLSQAIGLAVDVPGNKMWATDLGGNLIQSDLAGRNHVKINGDRRLGMLCGMEYVE